MVQTCVVYMRTSSAANVGEGKDSESRQLRTCLAYAEQRKYTVRGRFSDPAVSGSDPLIYRHGFCSMTKFCIQQGIHLILLECADRFARDVLVQETGLKWLREAGLRVETADQGAAIMNDESPTAVLLRQVLGSVSQFTAAQIRDRLSQGRQKKRSEVAADGQAPRSLSGKPKLGGPKNSFDGDRDLYDYIRQKSRSSNVNLTHLAKDLKKHKPKRWCVREGPNKGQPWSAKHVGKLLSRFERGKDKAYLNNLSPKSKAKSPKAKAKAKARKSKPTRAQKSKALATA